MNLDKNIKKNEYGDYVDAQGNVYYQERVLRYRVYKKYVGKLAEKDERWSLVMSAQTMEDAKDMMDKELAYMHDRNYFNYEMKVEDKGKEDVFYSLAY